MASYSLTLSVDPIILANNASDNLNIAKNVNGKYTVVFQGASINPVGSQSKLFASNTFNWVEAYQVFLSIQYKAGMLASACTSAQHVKYGQKAVYEKNDLQPAKPADPAEFSEGDAKKSFILGQIPASLHASVSCKTGDRFTPIYVDSENHNGVMDKQLTPLGQYCIFWDNKVVTESMIDYGKTHDPFEFQFGDNEFVKSFRYGYITPNHPKPNENPQWF